MYGPDEDDVVEHGGAPPRLPGWARRPRWLPAPGWRPSRGAAILGLAGLLVGLVAGYTFGYRHLGQAVRPSSATAAGAVPSAGSGSVAPSGQGAPSGASFIILSPSLSPSPGVVELPVIGLAQTTGSCSVQHGRELQVGVEVINLTGTTVILGQVKPILPLGGLRPVSKQWAPCGAISPSWEEEGGTPGGAVILPPNGTTWLSVTFRVLAACPRPLPVQFSVSYQENERTGTARLPGFPDLGQVAYTGCKGS
jgi:hypothetical protein